jgi:hypothetical protein
LDDCFEAEHNAMVVRSVDDIALVDETAGCAQASLTQHMLARAQKMSEAMLMLFSVCAIP